MITEPTVAPPDATLVIEAAAFLIVLIIVGRYVLPKVRANVERRQADVAEALAAADAAERRSREAESEARATLVAARRQARAIKDRAHAMKEQLVAEGRRAGQAEYNARVARLERENARHDDLISRQAAKDRLRRPAQFDSRSEWDEVHEDRPVTAAKVARTPADSAAG